MIANIKAVISGVIIILLIDHVLRDPLTGEHYFVWRRL